MLMNKRDQMQNDMGIIIHPYDKVKFGNGEIEIILCKSYFK